jgi:D-3-phosphoglycerate dehydrogenase
MHSAATRILPRSSTLVRKSWNRALTTGSTLSVELEHYTSGWTDIQDFSHSGKWNIKTFNKISPLGLAKFPSNQYEVRGEWENKNASAILLRSHKLQETEVDVTVRAIAR